MNPSASELRKTINGFLEQKDLERAKRLIEETLQRAQVEKNEGLKAEMLRCKALVLYHEIIDGYIPEEDVASVLSQAFELLEESANLARYYGDAAQQAWVRLTMALFREYQLELTRVSHLLEDALLRSKRGDDKEMLLETIFFMARVLDKYGLLSLKESLIDEALMTSQTINKKAYLPWFLVYKAKIELSRGNLDNVKSLTEEAYEGLADAMHLEELSLLLERLKAEDAYLRAQMSKLKASLENMNERKLNYMVDLMIVEKILEEDTDDLSGYLESCRNYILNWRFNQYWGRALYYIILHLVSRGHLDPAKEFIQILTKRIRQQKGFTEFYRYLGESLMGYVSLMEKDVEKTIDHLMTAVRGFDALSKDLKLSNELYLALARVLDWIANLDSESLDEAKHLVQKVGEDARNDDLIILHIKSLLTSAVINAVATNLEEAHVKLKSAQDVITKHGLAFIQNKVVSLEEIFNSFGEEVPPEERSHLLFNTIALLDF